MRLTDEYVAVRLRMVKENLSEIFDYDDDYGKISQDLCDLGIYAVSCESVEEMKHNIQELSTLKAILSNDFNNVTFDRQLDDETKRKLTGLCTDFESFLTVGKGKAIEFKKLTLKLAKAVINNKNDNKIKQYSGSVNVEEDKILRALEQGIQFLPSSVSDLEEAKEEIIYIMFGEFEKVKFDNYEELKKFCDKVLPKLEKKKNPNEMLKVTSPNDSNASLGDQKKVSNVTTSGSDIAVLNQPMFEAIKKGDLNVLRNLLESGNTDINARDIKGLSALHLASLYGHQDIIKYLVIDKNFPYFEEVTDHGKGGKKIIMDITPPFGPVSLALVSIAEIAVDDKQLAANIIFMRGLAKTFAETNALPKLAKGVDLNNYLNMAIQAIEIIERSRNEPDFIQQNPDEHEIDRKLEFQREALSWVAACLTIAHFNDHEFKLAKSHPEIPFAQIRSLINITDLINMSRGRQHGADGLIFYGDKDIIDNFLPDLLNDLLNLAVRLRYVVNQANPAPTVDQTCPNIKSLSNYYTDISILKIVKVYTNLITNPHFNLNTPINIEAMLRGLEAIGEAISTQLTFETRSLYNGLNTTALAKIRICLDHINGDNEEHRVLNKKSRAVRLEELVQGRDPTSLQILENVKTEVIPEIASRTCQILTEFDRVRVYPAVPASQQALFKAGKEVNDNYLDQALDDYQTDKFLGYHEAPRREALDQTKNNIRQLHSGFLRQPMHQMHLGESDYLDLFLQFLSTKTNLVFGTSVMDRLKANYTNGRRPIELSVILKLSPKQTTQNQNQLVVLRDLTRSINSNMEYVVKTADRLEQVWQFYEQFSRGQGSFAFGTPKASTAMNACIKSIEFNLINFSEHAHEVCNNQSFRDYYQSHYHEDIKDYFETLIFQTRNYFSHITINKHNIEKPLDHSMAILELRKEFIYLTPKLREVQSDMQRYTEPLLQTNNLLSNAQNQLTGGTSIRGAHTISPLAQSSPSAMRVAASTTIANGNNVSTLLTASLPNNQIKYYIIAKMLEAEKSCYQHIR